MAAAANEFSPLTIAALADEPGDTRVLTFALPPALAAHFAFKPGQHVAVRAMIDGVEVRRTYSICAGPNAPLRIGIKRADAGVFSTWAHRALQVGGTLDVMPPAGRFVLPPPGQEPRRIVLFAAGSGITPCLGIIRQALETEAATHVTLVYGNRRRDQAIFAGELDELKDRFLGRFEWLSVFSAEGEADVPLFGGRIDAGKVRTLGERLIDYAAAERIFVCGPGGMIKAVRDELLALGVPRETIAHEFFAPPGGAQPATPRQHVAVPAAEATHQVIIVVDGVRHRLGVNAGDVVLDVALAAGVKAPYACRGGMCSTCRCKVIEGRVEMRLNYSLEPWELERGFVLACQAVPATPAVTLDFDAM